MAPLSHWYRTAVTAYCGYCGDEIPRGELVYQIYAKGAQKKRCASCAGVPVPMDIPALPARPVPSEQFGLSSPVRSLGELVLDWKQRQSRERG